MRARSTKPPSFDMALVATVLIIWLIAMAFNVLALFPA